MKNDTWQRPTHKAAVEWDSPKIVIARIMGNTSLKAAVGNLVININNFFVFFLEKM